MCKQTKNIFKEYFSKMKKILNAYIIYAIISYEMKVKLF